MGQFILKHIDMTLDQASINQAIREVKDFEKRLKPAMQSLIEYLGEKGIEIARAELIFFDDPAYMTGDLSESVRFRMEGEDGILSAGEGLTDGYGNGSYAIYVEYGTGIYGEDVNGHGEAGWWYPAPWGTMTADDGTRLAWTNGMPPRPFMSNTLHDLEDEARVNGGRIIAEYIRGERA